MKLVKEKMNDSFSALLRLFFTFFQPWMRMVQTSKTEFASLPQRDPAHINVKFVSDRLGR